MLPYLIALLIAAPPGSSGLYHKWFESQLIPPGNGVFSGKSCCATSDGHILEEDDWRIAGDHYEVRVEDHWFAVPETRVLPHSLNPTGKPVVWYMLIRGPELSLLIHCFAPGTEA